MGRWIARSAAADPQAHWYGLHPAQRFLNSCGLAVVALVVGAYGMAGMVYGYLHFFVIEGFALLQGFVAWMVSLGCLALAWASLTVLVQRHWSGASATRCESRRTMALWIWGICWAAALVVELLASMGSGRHRTHIAIAPDSQWMLAPLPWLWPYFIDFAADRIVLRLFLIGGGSLAAGALVFKLWPRAGAFFWGLTSCAAGAYCLGDASYQYAAARALGGLGVPGLARELSASPGVYNAWTFVCWWGGWAFLAFGTLMIAAGLFMPTRSFGQASR